MNKPKGWFGLEGRAISNLIVVILSISFYLCVTHFDILWAQLTKLADVSTPFIAGFAVAYLLNTPTNFFEQKVYVRRKHARALAVATVYLIALLLLVVLLNLILPQVVESAILLASRMSGYIANLNDLLFDLSQRFELDQEILAEVNKLIGSYQDAIRNLASFVAESLPQVFQMGVNVGNLMVTILTTFVSSIYMLLGKDTLVKQIKKLTYAAVPKKKAERVLTVCRHANDVFSGFINGKLLDSVIIGILCFIVCAILQIPFAPLLSLVIGLTNIIPFFGPIIGAVPCILILLIVDPWAALRFLIMVIALQQFDGNILGPKILGDSTGLSAIWVLVSIVIGGGLFGFPGMLLGVPTFAVIYSLVREWTANRLTAKGINEDGEPLPEKGPK